VSLQLVAVLAAGVALVAAPFGVAIQSAGAAPLHAAAAPLGATAVVADYAPSAAHPFSEPIWLPLRNSTGISCVRTNCLSGGGDYHGYWAIDFLGQRGDPIYAAGAGILHIGANERTCGTSTTQSAGVWVWVDHGGGRVTKYTHLDSVVATEGQLVTPTTVIGRMGHWGDVAPCTTNYLHFEVREQGVTGPRVDPRTLSVCTESGGKVSLPGALNGATSFDALPKLAYRTPTSTSSCITDVWNQTPVQPTLSAVRAPSSAKLSWSTPPAGTTSVRIATQLWSPSVGRWNAVTTYTTLTGAPTSTTLAGLTNGRTYRMFVSHKNAAGYSAWSAPKTVIPATVPSVPKSPRYLTSPTRDYVHYGWYKSTDNGAAVTRYTTQVRCYKLDRYLPWVTATTDGATYYYNHRGLTGYATCQVRVRAENGMGASAWSTVSTIKKAR
jgi:hypothetical protein